MPTLMNAFLAIFSAILLTLAFPNFDLWLLAWFALVPLFYAIEREKESAVKTFFLGWIFGTVFFAASCWWLTFSFTHYGGIPTWLAYILLFIITGIVGIFPAMFRVGFFGNFKTFRSFRYFVRADFMDGAGVFSRNFGRYELERDWLFAGFYESFDSDGAIRWCLSGRFLDCSFQFDCCAQFF